MRWTTPSLVVSSLACVGSVLAAAKTPSGDTFSDFHSRQLAASPVKLDNDDYARLVRSPRNYTTAILLTAMDPRYGCQLCREFQPEYDLLAKSWSKGDKTGKSRVVFASLDFNDGRDTFVQLGLQTAPVLFLYLPTSGPHAAASAEPLRYDFSTGPGPAEKVRNWMARHLPDRPHPEIRRPVNWFGWIIGVTLSLGTLTGLFVAWPYVLPIIQNRNLWAGLSLIGILLFISGHMFNQIRKVPYVTGDGRGGVQYFSGGFQNQYGMETQIIAAIYGALAFASISLAVKVPRIADARMQKIAAACWAGLIIFVYSFLMSVFRMKNGGYPFSLPPFM